ncbi:hypothetical protein EXIGLDRAFT_746988 [Exidia glandulosa HHB12029]|uniref:Uncharacterized protein n=1 Tax=Exidia glandulosa HHB12029 TaxID=1314781 RepID=A0A165LDL7_EXIGL|nr:hypothetical protein EXIGLDRAFT_746988 [Exidia glandulosa HHB12029]
MAREASLSASRLSSLEAVVSAACDDIYASSAESHFEDTGGLFNLIRTVVDTQVAAWIRRRNALHSPVYRLPSKAFRAVLYPLGNVDRLAVARVCKQWKNWSALCSVLLPFRDYITDADSRRFNAELAAMRHPPLELKRLSLELSEEYFPSTVNFTLEHMWHIETLDVALLVESGSRTNDQLATLTRCLSTPASRLRNLKIGFESLEGLERFQDRCDWFGGHAPNLRRCQFFGSAFYRTSFSSLRTASFWMDERTRTADIHAILNQFPCLEGLCLESEDSIGLSPAPFIASSRLKHLWIDSHLAEDLRNIDFSGIAHIFLRGEYVLPMPTLQRLMPNCVLALEVYPEKLRVTYGRSEIAVRVRASCTQRSSRPFSMEPPPALNQLPHAPFAHTTTLSVHNFLLLEGVLLPDMPALASLTISSRCSSYQQSRSTSLVDPISPIYGN